MLWSIPLVAVASTLAGAVLASRTSIPAGAAVPSLAVPAVITARADGEIGDPSLRALIGRFAESARARR